MKHIVASIMCGNSLNLNLELSKLEQAGIKWLHCDVMDGNFVNNLAMAPYNIEPIIKQKKFIIDIHLATETPLKYIEMFAPMKPNYLTFHIEVADNVDFIINKIRTYNIKVGIAISPQTDLSAIESFLDKVDLILVMTVNPGFAGQVFQPHVLDKLKLLNEKLEQLKKRPLIEVDGNIYSETIKLIKPIGADLYVVGTSALFNQKLGSYKDKVAKLHSLI